MKGKASELYNDTEKKPSRRLEIYWFTTVDTENKKEEPLKLRQVSLTTDLLNVFIMKQNMSKWEKSANGMVLSTWWRVKLEYRENSNTLRLEAMEIERNNITESDLML